MGEIGIPGGISGSRVVLQESDKYQRFILEVYFRIYFRIYLFRFILEF